MENILLFLGWWLIGFTADVATDWAIYRNLKENDWVGSVGVGCLGMFWLPVCALALWSREVNGDLGGNDNEPKF